MPPEPSPASSASNTRPAADVEVHPMESLACAASGCHSADRDAASRGLIANVLVRSSPFKEHKSEGGNVDFPAALETKGATEAVIGGIGRKEPRNKA